MVIISNPEVKQFNLVMIVSREETTNLVLDCSEFDLIVLSARGRLAGYSQKLEIQRVGIRTMAKELE